MKDEKYIVYMDTGGTFSDAVLIMPDGNFVTGKASTTPNNLVECFFNCIADAASKIGKSLKEVLSKTDLVGFGTTAGTNTVITRTNAPKLGLITTKGVEDTTIVMRGMGAWAGRPQTSELMHAAGLDKVEPLIPRKLIRGVTGRVDSAGKIAIPLYEEEVRSVVREFVAEKVEGIAVCLLSSYFNNVHEQRVKEIIEEIAPGMPTSLSSEVSKLVREYPRCNSAIINLYIGPPVRKLFSQVKQKLAEYGYMKELLVLQGSGGLSRSTLILPVATLNSGPVGGLIGVNWLKNLYGIKNGIGSDVGGTSFDISIVPEEGPRYVEEPLVSNFVISNPMLEITCIGAGGGTIAYLDKITGLLRVGPESAGADPGPVCYGKGGTQPTVTDADLVMGRLDPEYFLGGQMKVSVEKARAAIKEKIADPLNMSVEEAALGICKIIDTRMKSMLEAKLKERGWTPHRFTLFCFGGGGATHCAGYSEGLGFENVIVTPFSAVFSAFGASTADVLHRYEASVYLIMPSIPFDESQGKFTPTSLDEVPSSIVKKFNEAFERLEATGYQEMAEEGFERKDVVANYEMSCRYGGQLYEVTCACPVSRLNTLDDFKTLLKGYETEYERLYTKQSLYPQGGLEIVTLTLKLSASTAAKPVLKKSEYKGEDPSAALKGKRQVYFEGGFVEAKVYAMGKLENGNIVQGPAIIEQFDTTLVIPQGYRVVVDEYRNMNLREK